MPEASGPDAGSGAPAAAARPIGEHRCFGHVAASLDGAPLALLVAMPTPSQWAVGLAWLAAGALACAAPAEPEVPEVQATDSTLLSLEWMITDGGALVSCPEAGASEIAITSHWRDRSFDFRLSCFGGFGTVGPVPAGAHSVEVSLLDPDGEPVLAVDAGEVSVTEGMTTPLGLIELPIAE